MTRRLIVCRSSGPTLEREASYQPITVGTELSYGTTSADYERGGYNTYPFSFSLPGHREFHVGAFENENDIEWYCALRAESKASALFRVIDLKWGAQGQLEKIHVEVLTDEDASMIRRERLISHWTHTFKRNWWIIGLVLVGVYFYLK